MNMHLYVNPLLRPFWFMEIHINYENLHLYEVLGKLVPS